MTERQAATHRSSRQRQRYALQSLGILAFDQHDITGAELIAQQVGSPQRIAPDRHDRLTGQAGPARAGRVALVLRSHHHHQTAQPGQSGPEPAVDRPLAAWWLGHIADHGEPPARGNLGQQIEGGIIGFQRTLEVIHQQDRTAPQRDRLQSTLDWLGRRQSSEKLVQRNAFDPANRGGSQNGEELMTTEQARLHGKGPAGQVQRAAQSYRPTEHHVGRAHVVLRAKATGHHPGPGLAGHPANVLIVAVQHREPTGTKPPEHLGLLVAGRLERAERALVFGADRRDDDDIGAEHPGVTGHLTWGVDADLEYGPTITRPQPEQR